MLINILSRYINWSFSQSLNIEVQEAGNPNNIFSILVICFPINQYINRSIKLIYSQINLAKLEQWDIAGRQYTYFLLRFTFAHHSQNRIRLSSYQYQIVIISYQIHIKISHFHQIQNFLMTISNGKSLPKSFRVRSECKWRKHFSIVHRETEYELVLLRIIEGVRILMQMCFHSIGRIPREPFLCLFILIPIQLPSQENIWFNISSISGIHSFKRPYYLRKCEKEEITYWIENWVQ